MSRTKTLNARASHFCGESSHPTSKSPPPRPLYLNVWDLPLHFLVKFFAVRGSRTNAGIVAVASNSIQISSLLIAFPKY